MDGITYFKLKSEYAGDYTKNCALNGVEVDNNFYVLEGRDIKKISVVGKDLYIEYYDSNHNQTIENVFDFVKDEDLNGYVFDVQFDKETGNITVVKKNGELMVPEVIAEGLVTKDQLMVKVATDSTLVGDGTAANPLGISPMEQTGQPEPVIRICDGVGELPDTSATSLNPPLVGDRYLVKTELDKIGYLYDFFAVRCLDDQLQNCGWRIPTKSDWDEMLNAIEPNWNYRNHTGTDGGLYGEEAGHLLKSTCGWKSCNDDVCPTTTPGAICWNTSESGVSEACPTCIGGGGVDAYGFIIYPIAPCSDCYTYVADNGFITSFWTSSICHDSNVYTKSFKYDLNCVIQEHSLGSPFKSIRLVKDFNGSNYKGLENILGVTYPTVSMPYIKVDPITKETIEEGTRIWTSINVSWTGGITPYDPVKSGFCPVKRQHIVVPQESGCATKTTTYMTYEWNGKFWDMKEFGLGESIVSFNEKTGIDPETGLPVYEKNYEEWRLVANEKGELELIKVSDQIIEEVKEYVDGEIAKEAAARALVDGQLADRIDAEAQERQQGDNQLEEKINEFKEEVEKKYVPWSYKDPSAPERKEIVLPNHSNLLGEGTDGGCYNLAMVSKWDVADFGSTALPFNINAKDRPTVNDNEKVAYLSDVEKVAGEVVTDIKYDGVDDGNTGVLTITKSNGNTLSTQITFDFGKMELV